MDIIGAALGTFLVCPAQLLGDVLELAHQVEPLANAHVMEELLLHAFAEFIAGLLVAGLFNVVPELKHGQEIRGLVLEAGVGLVGLGLEIKGAFANVLDGHGRDDDHDIIQASVGIGLNEHACHTGI